MPESTSSLADRVADAEPGLTSLIAEAQEVWRARAAASGADMEPNARPGWRAFEDAFPTFYQFTNRPR
jgi:hypothetical protein